MTMTTPLPSIAGSPYESSPHSGRTGPAFDSQLQLGEAESEEEDLPTEMVSVEEAFGGQIPNFGAFGQRQQEPQHDSGPVDVPTQEAQVQSLSPQPFGQQKTGVGHNGAAGFGQPPRALTNYQRSSG